MDTTLCNNRFGYQKKRYDSEQAAHRELARSHRWRHRRFPALYRCPGCGLLHLTDAGAK